MNKTHNVDGQQELMLAYRDLKQSLVLHDAHIMELISLIRNQRKDVLSGLIQAFGLKWEPVEPCPTRLPSTCNVPYETDEKLCSLIHPSVEKDRELLIHNEIKRLVTRHRLQDICSYLLQMRNENKILLPISPQLAYAELVRMGMPHGDGFSEKNFQKYYLR